MAAPSASKTPVVELSTSSSFMQIDAVLRELPAEVQRKIMRGAIRKGLKDIQTDAKGFAPKSGRDDSGGSLSDWIRITFKGSNQYTGELNGRVAVVGKKAPLAHLVEWGRRSFKMPQPIRTASGFRSPGPLRASTRKMITIGATQPDRFMTRAWGKNKSQFDEKLKKTLARRIKVAFKKVNRGAA